MPGDVAHATGRAASARTAGAAARPRSRGAPSRARASAAPGRGGSRRGCAAAAASAADCAARSTASTGPRTSSSSGRLGDRGLEAAAASRRRSPPACSRRRRLGAEHVGEGAVHLGRRLAERAGRPGEVGAGLGRVQRHAPGVLDAGQELLGEGEVTGCRRRRPPRPGAASCPVTAPTTAGTRREPASTSAPWRTTSGLSPGREHPEDLDDERGVVAVGQVAVEDHRGVGLLAGQHPRGAHVHLVRPARLRHTGDRLLHGIRRPSTTGPAPGPGRSSRSWAA